MTVAAIVQCDLTENSLGLPSRALDEIAGRAILAHTLDRLERCARIDVVAVLAPAERHETIRAALDGREVRLLEMADVEFPRQALLRRARKWALHTWRGGLLGATAFDDAGHPALLEAAERLDAETVVHAPPEWPLIDHVLLAASIDHHIERSGDFGFTFAQAPPGLLPPVFGRERLRKWAEKIIVAGDILRFNPQAPHIDFVLDDCCYQVPGAVLRCEHRLAADADRGIALVEAVFQACGPEPDAEAACLYVAGHPEIRPPAHPREIELELTTRRPIADALRPLPPIDETEMPLDDAVRLVRQAAAGDDTLLTLGGRGDPLLHPGLPAVLRAAHEAGVYGLHVVTYGRHLTEDLARTLVETGVDAVTFLLDARTPAAYAASKGGAPIDPITEGLTHLRRAREAAGVQWPIPVVELVKTADTLPEMEAFYDEWLSRGAWPVIRGPSDLCGLVEDQGIVSMAPARRFPCRRPFRRLTVHATGQAPACEEDVLCRQPVGNALTESIEDTWRGERCSELRRAHLEGRIDHLPACSRCTEWHRP